MKIIPPTEEEIRLYEIEMASSDEETDEIQVEPSTDPLSTDPLKDPLAVGQTKGSSAQPITLDEDSNDSDIQVISDTTPTKKTQPIVNKNNSTPKKQKQKVIKKKDETNYPPFATFKYEVEEIEPWDNKVSQVRLSNFEQVVH